MLKKAYDCGINFFETGDMYGKGKSEKLIGEAFKGMRDEVVISTKYGYDFESAKQIGHKELPQKFDEKFTRNALEKSLERLQTNYLDMYGLHNPKMYHIHDDSIFKTLDTLKNEEKMIIVVRMIRVTGSIPKIYFMVTRLCLKICEENDHFFKNFSLDSLSFALANSSKFLSETLQSIIIF